MDRTDKQSKSLQQIEKKIHERQFLDEFRAIYAEFPVGNIVESEEPDFLILTDMGTVGIEVLEFHKKERGGRNSVIREKEVFHETLAGRAKSSFEGKLQIPLEVTFVGHGNRRNARERVLEEFSNSAAELISKWIPQEVGSTVQLGPRELKNTSIQKVVHSIFVTRLKPGRHGLWSFTEGSWTEVTNDELQKEISGKDSKIDRYLKQCSSIWLLIIVGGHYIATVADFPSDLKQHCFQSRFEKVIVYNHLERSITRLSTRS